MPIKQDKEFQNVMKYYDVANLVKQIQEEIGWISKELIYSPIDTPVIELRSKYIIAFAKKLIKECRKKSRVKAVKKYKLNTSLAMAEKELVSDVTIREALKKAGLHRMYFDPMLNGIIFDPMRNGIIFECVRKPVFEDGKEWLEEV